MPTTSVSARFQELFPETNLISLLTKYGGDADDIFEAIQDRYDAHEQEPLVCLRCGHIYNLIIVYLFHSENGLRIL